VNLGIGLVAFAEDAPSIAQLGGVLRLAHGQCTDVAATGPPAALATTPEVMRSKKVRDKASRFCGVTQPAKKV
jgi:hypothetical protein